MARDPLPVLHRLRSMAVDVAQSELGVRLNAYQKASEVASQAQAQIRVELEAASKLDAGDGAVEAFARWLPRGRANAARARHAAEQAETECSLARTRLSAARAAKKVIETLLDQREEQAQATSDRHEQSRLDEAGSRGGFVADE